MILPSTGRLSASASVRIGLDALDGRTCTSGGGGSVPVVARRKLRGALCWLAESWGRGASL
eukprot:scaffold35226_cov66-Phaeocystis_antarctica.AAC.2